MAEPKQLSASEPKAKRLPALLAAAGVLLSAVLEVLHVRAYEDPAASSFCSVGQTLDCTTVALSSASVFLGVPLPIWGIAGFLAIGTTAWNRSRLFLWLSALAAVASVALLAIEIAVVGSVCLLCEGVHLLSLALFVVAWRQRDTLSGGLSPRAVARELALPAAVVVAAFVLMPPYYKLFSWRTGVEYPHGTDEEGHPWIGAAEPKLVLHEYTDYGCPHCALSASRTRKLISEHPEEVRVVRHQQPRMRCKNVGTLACHYARAAVCAGREGKFWEMDTWLFRHAPGKATVDFDQAARDVGVDPEKLSTCMARPETYARVDREVSTALRQGIRWTPAYVVDGKKLRPDEIAPVIDAALQDR